MTLWCVGIAPDATTCGGAVFQAACARELAKLNVEHSPEANVATLVGSRVWCFTCGKQGMVALVEKGREG